MKKAIELAVVLAGVSLFVTPTGLRVGTKGRVQQDTNGVENILSKLTSKGERRAVRKALHRAGHGGLAAAGLHNHQTSLRKAA